MGRCRDCQADRPARKVLTAAAKAACWQVPPTSVNKFMKQHCSITVSGSECDIVAGALLHILKCSDIDLAKYLELRSLHKHMRLTL